MIRLQFNVSRGGSANEKSDRTKPANRQESQDGKVSLPLGAIAHSYTYPADEVLAFVFVTQDDVPMKLIMRKALVRWKGGSNHTRLMSTESGVLKQARCSWGNPRKESSATDPAELIAAAHASSFFLALSHELGLAGSALGQIVITTTVTLEHLAAGWRIMNIHLNVIARLPKLTQGEFIDATVRAKTSCLLSGLLRANISTNAKLEKGSRGHPRKRRSETKSPLHG